MALLSHRPPCSAACLPLPQSVLSALSLSLSSQNVGLRRMERTMNVVKTLAHVPGNTCTLWPQMSNAVQATVDTSAKCTSKVSGGGKAQGCAFSAASSSAFQVAFAKAHASATSAAFAKYCSCNKAASFSFGESETFLTLVSGAYTKASSVACSSGAYPLCSIHFCVFCITD